MTAGGTGRFCFSPYYTIQDNPVDTASGIFDPGQCCPAGKNTEHRLYIALPLYYIIDRPLSICPALRPVNVQERSRT